MASIFLKRKAEEQAKKADKKYGEGTYGSTSDLKQKRETATTKPTDYSSTVKYLQGRGIQGASGIMTENEWRRRNRSGGTYQSYLDEVVRLSQPVELSVEVDGGTQKFGKLTLGGYEAIEGNTLDRYVPRNEEEANTIASYTKFVEDRTPYFQEKRLEELKTHNDDYWQDRFETLTAEGAEEHKGEPTYRPAAEALVIVKEEKEKEEAELRSLEQLVKANKYTTEITSKSDFEQNSKYSPRKPKTDEELKAAGYTQAGDGSWMIATAFGPHFYTGEDSDLYIYINDKGQRENISSQKKRESNNLNDYEKMGYNTLTEKEIAAFNYLYHQDRINGTNTAEKYLGNISPLLQQRAMALDAERYAKLSKEAPVFMSGVSLGTNLANGFMFPAKIAATVTGTYEDMPMLDMYGNRTQAIRGAVSEDMGTVGKLLYNGAMSIGDMGTAMLASAGNAKFMQAIMSSSAGSSTISEAKKNGASDGKALVMGLGSAAIEWATEKYSIEAILKDPETILGFLVTNTVTEGTEEGVSNIANTALDAIVSEIFGERNEIEQMVDYLVLYEGKTEEEALKIAFNEKLKSLGEDVLVGGLTGFGMAGGKVSPIVAQKGIDGIRNRLSNDTIQEGNVSSEQQTATPDTLEQAARDVVADRNAAQTAETTPISNASATGDNMSAQEASAQNAPRNARRNATDGAALAERLEAQSLNNEPITAEDVKEASVYGDYGAEMLAERVNNTEGATFNAVNNAMRNAYLAGLADIDSKKLSFETDLQIDAFTAGKKDAAMKRMNAEGQVGQSLERDLIQQGVPLTDRRNIIQAATEIEGSLTGTKQSISSVVSGVRKITNNLARVISQKVGTVQNLWGLLHTNLKALQSDSVFHNRDLVSAYADTYLDAMKNNESGRYNEISAGVQNVSGALTEYLVNGVMPDGVQNQEVFLSAAEDIGDIVRMAEEMLGNAREQLYGNKTSSAEKDVLSNGSSNDIIEASTGAKVSYSLERKSKSRRKTRYDEYQTNAMRWARRTSTRPGDSTILNMNGKYFVLIEATEDGFIEIVKGNYKEVQRYEQAYRRATDEIYGNTEGFEADQGRDIWDMQPDGNRGDDHGNNQQTESQRLQNNSAGDNEYLYSSNQGEFEKQSEVNENEQGQDLLSDDGSKRKYSKSSGRQARKVDGRSSRYKEGKEAARERRKRCQALKDAGNTRKRVVLGHRCEVIPKEHYDSEMAKLVKENEKNGIDETILVVGGIELPKGDSNGKAKTAKGMFIETADGRRIVVVQCDNEYFSPKQINDHELVHNDYGSERTQWVKNIILKTLPVKKRFELLGVIQDDYSGILEDLEGDALEEAVADILSGMHSLSKDFIELSNAYFNKDDAFIKRWEYEVSKKSFAEAVEKGYASEMERINRQLAYDEYVQLNEYIMDVNNRPGKLKKADCTEIGNHFYVWRNKSKTAYEVLFRIPLEGNTVEIKFIRGELDVYNRGKKGFLNILEVLDARYGNDNWGGTINQDIRTGKTTLSIYESQSEGDGRGDSGEGNRDTSGNRIKYALDENGMWEIEHIFENDDPEAEAAMMRDWKALLEKYGAIPKGENPARDVEVPKKTADGRKVSQTVRTILEAKATPDEAIPSIEKMVTDGDFSYDVYSDKKAISDANATIEKKGFATALTDWASDTEKGNVSKESTALGWALYNNAANSGDIKTAMTVLNKMVQHQRSAAQALQATRILKKLSPEGQLYGAQRSVESLQQELTDKYGDKAPELKIDEELAEKFLKAETQEERDAIAQEIYKDIGSQMPSRFIDKWNAWRYLAMLGNARTHIRNIVGNAAFAPVVITKDLTATAIESVVSRVSGKKTVRGKAIITGNKADRALLKAAWSDYGNVAEMISNGGKYNDSAMANQYIEEGRQIFKLKPLEWARKKNSQLLESEDMWFSKPHYAYALAQYCKANNITAEQIERGKAIAPAREYAIKEAQKATYRDTNAFSQFISELGRSGNKKNPVTKGASVALEGILPFRKTPANILVRGVEYSPLGLLKGLSYDLVQVSKGKMSATEAIDNISAGLTGTGLLALGIYLAAQGLIRGHGEEDKDEKEFKELTGHQSYALELPNGQSITLDWLAPEALPFFVGVNIWEATKGSEEEVNLSTILQSVTHITEPMLEMSCLQGLNDLIEGMGYASSNDTSGLVALLSSAATSYLTQGIPTLLGQAERTGEESRMTTYTEKDDFLTGDAQYTLGKASAKIPFWDYKQIPYVDAWGRKEASGTALKRGLNNFLNPAYTSTVDESKMEKELLRLYEATGEGGVFPERADKYFTVDGKRKDLTGEEYVRYATLKGQKSYKLVSDLVKSDAYKKLSNEEKAKAVKEAYDYANQKAKQAISNYKPDTWVQKADEFGSNVGSYISFKTEVSGTKEDNGGKISKQEVAGIALDMAQNDSDTWKMYLSMYDSDSDLYAYNNGVDGKDYMYFIEALAEVDAPTKSGKYGTYTQAEATKAVNRLEGLTRKEKSALWQSVNTTWKKNPF